jgi:hypothetical protein
VTTDGGKRVPLYSHSDLKKANTDNKSSYLYYYISQNKPTEFVIQEKGEKKAFVSYADQTCQDDSDDGNNGLILEITPTRMVPVPKNSSFRTSTTS